ncbi:aminopeptidase N-like isoform X4 [Periplaneta americana]|uniref:aminopeptidase N-like isoform X4 n=1 Tax=Periplaneta americana TaxID=6978 RepID=UPI0037E8DBE7
MPSDLIMFGYHLYLHPNFEGSYFKGHVKITIIAYNLSHDITLHASENLDISAADITVQTNTELESERPTYLNVTNVKRDSNSQELTITVEEEFKKENHYDVEIPFVGTFTNPKEDGFFIIDYVSQEMGEKKWYAVISVKPGTARKVFPCLDDSYNKTSFSISVARRKSSDLNIISSSAKVSTTENKDDPDYVWENFEELPQILPSSFGLVITDLQKQDSRTAPDFEDSVEWLLRMLNYSLSEDTFSSGFKRFMLDRLYSIYSDEDLWYFLMKEGYLQEILDETFTIEELADIWLGTQRYPIVTVTRNYEDKKAIISQHTFIKQRPHTSSENETLWIIPIMYLSPSNLDTSKMRTSAWMNNEKEVNISGLPGSDDFIIVNPEEIGMFMVNYDPQNWNLLSDYLQSGTSPEIPALTRAKLLHDAWNIGYSGELDMTTALDLTLFLPHEKNSAVWSPFLNLVDHIHRLISGTSVEPKFVKYILKLLSTQSQDEDWVYSNLCAYGYEPYVAKGRESYNKWMNSNEKSLDYDVSVRDLCNALKWGSYEEYEFGLQQLQKYPDNNADLSEKRSFLLSALAACPLHAEKTNSLLKLVFQDEPHRFSRNDVYAVVSQFSNHATGWTTWYDFLSDNWNPISDRYKNDDLVWKEMIKLATQHFITQEGLDKVKALHLAHERDFGSAESEIQAAEIKGMQEVKWSNKNLAAMEAWLDRNLQQ